LKTPVITVKIVQYSLTTVKDSYIFPMPLLLTVQLVIWLLFLSVQFGWLPSKAITLPVGRVRQLIIF
jgi:hypothetical protein